MHYRWSCNRFAPRSMEKQYFLRLYAMEFLFIVLMAWRASQSETEKKTIFTRRKINSIPETWSKALRQTNNSFHGKSLIK